jgi:uncharacterized protein
MRIVHLESKKVIAENVKYANTFLSRLIGLMFVKEMTNMDALLLENSNSIHNCFVRFSLDVVFLDNENKVVRVLRGFKPWRFTRIHFRAKRVLELKAGTLIDEIKKGDQLEVLGV